MEVMVTSTVLTPVVTSSILVGSTKVAWDRPTRRLRGGFGFGMNKKVDPREA